MSQLGQTGAVTTSTPSSSLLREILEQEWRELIPLLAVLLLSHLIILGTLLWSGRSFVYLPQGELRQMTALVLTSTLVGPLGFLVVDLVADIRSKVAGRKPPPLAERFHHAASMMAICAVVVVAFDVAHISYKNLKPAIPLLNPADYDMALEVFERGLFGGVLPSEWIAQRLSAPGFAFWNLVYELFGPFLLVGLAIAARFEGVRGAARLGLALVIGLLFDVFLTLAFPTRGPIFTHPEWFREMAHTSSAELAAFLALTVEQYRSQGIVYANAGISAMPSFHVYAWMCALFCWRWLPPWAWIIGALAALLNWISTFALGWHYLLDGVVGAAFAALVWWSLWKSWPPKPRAPESPSS